MVDAAKVTSRPISNIVCYVFLRASGRTDCLGPTFWLEVKLSRAQLWVMFVDIFFWIGCDTPAWINFGVIMCFWKHVYVAMFSVTVFQVKVCGNNTFVYLQVFVYHFCACCVLPHTPLLPTLIDLVATSHFKCCGFNRSVCQGATQQEKTAISTKLLNKAY